jgi:mannosyltransferase OCH1-like enzyme
MVKNLPSYYTQLDTMDYDLICLRMIAKYYGHSYNLQVLLNCIFINHLLNNKKNMTTIPKIIHQIWVGEPLPNSLKELGDTWKEYHPGWEYRLWNECNILSFIIEYFPEYVDFYHSFHYDIQRLDAIRYLILYQTGGMYVDFDYECLENIEFLLYGKTCCFAMEPDIHAKLFNKEMVFNNALMASIPSHLFLKKVIEKVFSKKTPYNNIFDKREYVLNTTGPWMLGELYNTFEDKTSIYLIPAKFVSPFTKMEAEAVIDGVRTEYLEKKLNEAYAVHYFLGTWL